MKRFFNVPAPANQQQESKGLDYYRPQLCALQETLQEMEARKKEILQRLGEKSRKYEDGFVFSDGRHIYQVEKMMSLASKGFLELNLLYQVKDITPHVLIIVDTAFFSQEQIDSFLKGS